MKIYSKGIIITITFIVLLSKIVNSQTGVCLSPQTNYPSGATPNGVIAADINLDGKLDIVSANRTGNNISVFLNNGNGTYTTAVNYTTGGTPREVISSDFNVDGFIDIAVSNQSTNDVSVFFGAGNGTFLTAINYSVGTGPMDLTSSDFNGDGKPDIASANSNSSNVSILLNNGSGAFTTAVNYLVGNFPMSIKSADFNSDGNQDLAIANRFSNNVSILNGNGNGTFAVAINYTVGTGPWGIANGDFNGDGKQDLATSNITSNNVSVLLNNGSGTFLSAVNYPTGSNTSAIITADMNNDGKLDLAIPGGYILTGNSNGTFNISSNYGVWGNKLSAGDLNSDSKIDLISTDNTNMVEVYLSTLILNVNILGSDSLCAGGILTAVGASTYSWSSGATTSTIMPSVSQIYSVSGTSLQCSNTSTISVYVKPLPVINAIPSQTVCQNNSFTITAVGGASYSWSGPGSFTSNLQTNSIYLLGIGNSGTYSVVGTGTNNCVNTATTTVTMKNQSNTTTMSGATSKCIGSSPTTVLCSGLNYTAVSWNSSPVGSIISFGGTFNNFININPTVTTVYNAIASYSNGCTYTNSYTVTVYSSPLINVNSGSICTGQSFTINPTGATTYTISGGSSVVSPTTNTSYSVSGTNSVGCISNSVAVSSVSVSALPVISSNSGSICVGQSFTINPIGAATYTISGGSSVVSPTTNTSYSVSGTNSVGCISNNVAVSSVSVNALPVISVNSGSICAGASFTMSPSGASTYTYSNGTPIVNPTINTSYSVTGTNSVGCVSNSAAVSSVSVIALPVISVNSGSICAGTSFTINPSGANTYTFNSGSAIVSPSANASYSISGSNAAGCVSNSVAVSNVTVNPLPMITVGTTNTLLCSGQSASLTAIGVNTYTWNTNSNSNSNSNSNMIIVSPTVNTTYTISGSDANGCSNTTVFTQSVSTCTGIDNIKSNLVDFTLYPNPIKDILKVSGNNIKKISITNNLGQSVKTIDVNNQIEININLEDILPGIYFVNITDESKNVSVKKIIKE